jgi:hypothetical protein
MAGRLVRWSLVLAFAAALGHVAWHAVLGPPQVPTYFIEGDGLVLSGPDPARKMLYLRRKFFVSQRPHHAWVQVVARDRFQVYINGQKVGEQRRDGFTAGVVADLAPYLQAGANVLAINAEQASIGYPPAVAVIAAYTIGGREHVIGADESWRCAPVFAHGADWWFSTRFDDHGWAFARVTRQELRAQVDGPPRATTQASIGSWISSPSLTARQVAFRREVEVAGRPRCAWLRVTAASSYLLAVNGFLIDASDESLGTEAPAVPFRRTYDLTTAMRRGQNSVAVLLTATDSSPHLLADLEVEDEAGNRYRVGTDGKWLSYAGVARDWSQLALDSQAGWRACLVQKGDLGIPPWLPQRRAVAVALPTQVFLERVAGQLALIAAIAVLALVGCGAAGRFLARRRAAESGMAPATVAYLALLPPSLALLAAILSCYDPRVARQDVFRDLWLWLAIASVPLQWLLLAVLARGPAVRWRAPSMGLATTIIVLLGLMAAGFWLRIRNIDLEPLMYDEVCFYQAAAGFLERGYPSIQLHPDMPVMAVGNDEFAVAITALAGLFVDDPIWVVRLPQVIFGTLVIALIFVTARTMFGRPVAWLATLLYTFSPVCIAMCNFGRYFEQTQFFTLLTVYFFWLTIRGNGPLRTRYVWLTAISYTLMYLCWEPAGLIAAGMLVAAVLQRRGRAATLLKSGSVWTGMATILLVMAAQNAHRTLMQTQRIKWHLGLTSMVVAPMWRYPGFDPWYYVRESGWINDALIPLIGLALAALFAIRHAYRKPLRFLLWIYLSGCVLTVALLPMTTFRYANQLIPLNVLLSSAAFVACARALARSMEAWRTPLGWRRYAAAIGLLPILALLALANGYTLQLLGMPRLRAGTYGTTVFKFPAVRAPIEYLRTHLREGDAVISTVIHQVNFTLDGPSGYTDYYLQSYLGNAMELTESSPVLRETRSGAVTVLGLNELKDLFARHKRIWYLAVPQSHANLNSAGVSAFLREHMDVVYEDFDAVVLLRGDHNWTAGQREEAERALPSPHAGHSAARSEPLGSPTHTGSTHGGLPGEPPVIVPPSPVSDAPTTLIRR